ncbi:MAG: phosphoribosylformylglycinamidine synthase subunit PurL [Bacteroidetes bacterium]|nr:phosphoribosylformylglycinamidine synthase subunit PurL [Bacteroidota bacterium]
MEVARKLGLNADEYAAICGHLGRQPNFTELSVYSVMWSEHCSYKNSILWLKKLPKEGPRVLAGAGEENAGLMDLGDGLAVCFKIESHNHPSAIEPYQGAATGVGGIHRDIFTMGARPIASLNSLRFGSLDKPRTRHLLRHVVRGIGNYGNAFGVPTVGGEIYFDPCYHTNPLVNAMSVGIVRHGQTVSAIAEGVGNPVFIVGSATGKDGIHGATFASADLTENSAESLPAVQVGDPFQEKLLLEATLEVIRTGAVVGMQDMGAAGIACSTSEMSAKGGVGIDLWLDKVPTRQADMLPFELLLSESQERMLLVAHKGQEQKVLDVFEKWDLPCVKIGVVTEGPNIRYYWHDELVGEIPAASLVLGGGAPRYEREMKEPAYMAQVRAFDAGSVQDATPDEVPAVIRHLLATPSIASKRWVTRQYDSTVGAANRTHNLPGDAALVNIQGTDKGLAMTTDCNSRYVMADPERGCALAVSEAARNIACSGGEPLGVTNCLNFGNPYNPEVYYQFAHAILGMKAACERYGLPVTGGNVSFYNQSSDDGPVYPTPTIGMVGYLPDMRTGSMSSHFPQAGLQVAVLGPLVDEVNCSEYLYSYRGVTYSPAPFLDMDVEARLQQVLPQLIRKGLIRSAHDVSDGGLAINLLESGFHLGVGVNIRRAGNGRLDSYLFGEAGGRVVVSYMPEQEAAIRAACGDLPFTVIGETGGDALVMDGRTLIPLAEARDLYNHAIGRYMDAQGS